MNLKDAINMVFQTNGKSVNSCQMLKRFWNLVERHIMMNRIEFEKLQLWKSRLETRRKPKNPKHKRNIPAKRVDWRAAHPRFDDGRCRAPKTKWRFFDISLKRRIYPCSFECCDIELNKWTLQFSYCVMFTLKVPVHSRGWREGRIVERGSDGPVKGPFESPLVWARTALNGSPCPDRNTAVGGKYIPCCNDQKSWQCQTKQLNI
jgi:hypothetical protein